MIVRYALAALVYSSLMYSSLRAQQPEAPITALGGISVPGSIDNMPASLATNPNFAEFAKQFRYQNGPDLVEIRVFQANYPNVGIWHNAHKEQSLKLLGSISKTSFGNKVEIVAHSNRPNGLVDTFELGPPFASTSIATIGFNRWVVEHLSWQHSQ